MLLFGISEITAVVLAGSVQGMMTVPIVLAALASPLFFMKKVIESTAPLAAAASKAIGQSVMTAAVVGASVMTMGGAGAAAAAAKGGGLLSKATAGLKAAGKSGFGQIPGMGGLSQAMDQHSIGQIGKQRKVRFGANKGQMVDTRSSIRAKEALIRNNAVADEAAARQMVAQNPNMNMDQARNAVRAQRTDQSTAAMSNAAILTGALDASKMDGFLSQLKAIQSKGIPLDAKSLDDILAKGLKAPAGSLEREQTAAIASSMGMGGSQVQSYINSDGTDSWSTKEGRASALADSARDMSAEKAAGLSSGGKEAIAEAISTLKASADPFYAKKGNEAEASVKGIEIRIQGNDNLSGKQAKSDFISSNIH
jgi:hypothetical protein